MAAARPRCPDCRIVLVNDGSAPDVWRCALCGGEFVRSGIHVRPIEAGPDAVAASRAAA